MNKIEMHAKTVMLICQGEELRANSSEQTPKYLR